MNVSRQSGTKVVVASDHAGFALKTALLKAVGAAGYGAVDAGTHSADPVDYPDIAEALAGTIRSGRAARGILICGSGVGASIAVNKIPGMRAAVCHDSYSAHQGVEHDDMNVLVLGARVIGEELARELVAVFLSASFSGEERHTRRLEKVKGIEEKYLKTGKRVPE